MISDLRTTAGRGLRAVQRRLLPPPAELPETVEIDVRLRSLGEWTEFVAIQGERLGEATTQRIVRRALDAGLRCRFLGEVPPAEVDMLGEDTREGFRARRLNARQRAVLDSLANHEWAGDHQGARIYAHEGLTELALALRGRYPRFLGSEYAEDAATAAWLWPVPAIDITRSGLPDAAFHFVLSNEVLEHVPDLGAALRDTARILKPGGRLIATFPFLENAEATQIRARLGEAGIEHLLPPEYHGNPVRPEDGSLVFQVPGWDILRQCREAGFADAWMRFLVSTGAGITASGYGGILVLEAER